MPLLSTFGAASARSFGGIGAAAAGAGLDIDEAFSAYLYEGTGSAKTITNGIDLSGEGGLVWIKRRDDSDYALQDTERGATKFVRSNTTGAEATDTTGLTSFNSNGFTLGVSNGDLHNKNNVDHVSWTFRKAPKFFDIVTYTGNGSARTISHNLGSAPSMIIIKQTNTTRDWIVYHRSLGTAKHISLNQTFAAGPDNSGEYWGGTTPTSTQFSLGDYFAVNQNGGTYVAYLFAHNNGDGGFGPNADQDVIKCGSYTGNGSSTGPVVNLGFGPQWLMIKRTDTGVYNWFIFDAMRGMPVGGADQYVSANLSDAEAGGSERFKITPTGFQLAATGGSFNASGGNYIYMAIRRGPLAEPTSATDVFAMDTMANQTPAFDSGFPVDMAIRRNLDFATSNAIWSRLTGEKYMNTDSNAAESNDSESFDHMDGWGDGSTYSGNQAWMWKRAPSYFDVVAYTGGSGADTISHNLGVAPEMIWVKNRDTQTVAARGNWVVYHASVSNGYLNLHDTVALQTADAASKFGNGSSLVAPTSSAFTVADDYDIGRTGNNYIAYLFASVAGVSKVGSVSHSFNSTTNVDCGFSSGARFVLVKSTATGDWYVWDSLRGIVTGNDPYFTLNTSSAEVTNGDLIDPYSGGFALSPSFYTDTYIFYAIA